MTDQATITHLETDLNSFDPKVRANALHELALLAQQGAIPLEPVSEIANMHCHTFFSYNAYGYSPSGLAWLAKRRGYKLLGIVDFDVLDAVDEFLDACELLGVRGSAGIETRMVLPEFSGREINSPGEPGIAYHIGIGFTSSTAPDSVKPILADLGQRASVRNQSILERVNAYLDPVKIDYEKDVLPLTPSSNPTERHMVQAYVNAAEKRVPNPAEFWASKLGMTVEQTTKAMADMPKFQNTLRTKLMKQGGVGYVQPKADSFPSIDQIHKLIVGCGALPCLGWLDGLSTGEHAIEELAELLISKGVVTLNIVPDRNWNIADPEVKRVKLNNLYHVVELAEKLDLPLNIGTEMNSAGNKLIDDFDVPEIAPVRQAFIDGAHFIYGHTVLQRAGGIGYQSEWAKKHLPSRRQRNGFYTKAGYQIQPARRGFDAALANLSPADVLAKWVERGS